MVRPLRFVPLSRDCPNSVGSDLGPTHICDFITALCCKEQGFEQSPERSASVSNGQTLCSSSSESTRVRARSVGFVRAMPFTIGELNLSSLPAYQLNAFRS